MTTATCTPTTQLVPAWEREHKPDRLDECSSAWPSCSSRPLGRRRVSRNCPRAGTRARLRPSRALIELERNLMEVSVEAATVHQLLMRARVI
jgi:hypothetical protein